MATPKELIDRLREDFDCSLKDEKIVSMINSLQARLCVDVIRPKEILKVSLKGGEDKISLGFDAQRVLALSISGSQIRVSDINFPFGFRRQGNDILLDFTAPKADAVIEYLKMPKPFTQEDFDKRALMLGDEFLEIYIYHILSREALFLDDVERLNNYSTIYSAALKSLYESVSKNSVATLKFSNVW